MNYEQLKKVVEEATGIKTTEFKDTGIEPKKWLKEVLPGLVQNRQIVLIGEGATTPFIPKTVLEYDTYNHFYRKNGKRILALLAEDEEK
jgi:hypothetical protein